MNQTDKNRAIFVALFVLVVLVALAGWLMGRDPSSLTGVLGAVVIAAGIGEASNVGKRFSFKPEAVGHD